MPLRVDVAIIGAGFAGSILAWILARQGVRVVLIDATQHPRFAIGESSTPIADTILRRLGETYQLPDLKSLSAWGSWQRSHPELTCGSKRGFSYFAHHKGERFREAQLGENSLLVAASPADEVADTHWYRPQVDQFFWRQAITAGAIDLTGYHVVGLENQSDGALAVHCRGARSVTVIGQWVIDASGQSGVLANDAKADNLANRMRTRSHSTFAHYRGVANWTDFADPNQVERKLDPFDADASAQHHLLDDGWVWMLRFNNGITSVGYTAKLDRPLASLDQICVVYPSLGELMQGAVVVAPRGGCVRSGRLQRWFDPVIDSRRIMLPTAAVTLDPLHSTGIAHALAGVERIGAIIQCGSEAERRDLTDQYRRSVMEETSLLDRLVSTAYEMLGDFDRFTAACMLYFAGAIRCEERYQRGEIPTHLWNADDNAFVAFVDRSCERLLARDNGYSESMREGIEPWNTAGLMNPSGGNRYAYTATKK